jgi:hypothetical protein
MKNCLLVICAIATVTHASAGTPVYSENFDAYSADSDLIGQHEWKRAGLKNSPAVSIPAKGINSSLAVAKNATATGDPTGAILKVEPFHLPAAGRFTYEFDVQRDAYIPGTALVGFGSSSSKAPAYAGIFQATFHVRSENYGEGVSLCTGTESSDFIAVPGNWYRIKVEVDLASKALVAVSVKDLSGGDPRISASDFQPLFVGKEGKNKGLEHFFDSDPAAWDAVFVRTGEQDAAGSGWIDNIEASVSSAAN